MTTQVYGSMVRMWITASYAVSMLRACIVHSKILRAVMPVRRGEGLLLSYVPTLNWTSCEAVMIS